MNAPHTPSKICNEQRESRELPRTLMGGTRAMRSAGIKYLPKEQGETTEGYTARLNVSVLFNAFKRTIVGMTGKVFSKPIVPKGDLNEDVLKWLENIDRAGSNINVFSQQVFKDGLIDGVSYILVDMPKNQTDGTLASERAAGIRPYFTFVSANNLIGWRSELIDGTEVLTQIRIAESMVVADGEYGEKVIDRVRVINRDSFEIWSNTNGPWAIDDQGPMSLGFIPLVPFYTNKTGFMTGDPPLEDLAWLNVSHWQSYSDQRHILHVARVPILFGKNIRDTDDEKIIIGPNRMVTADGDNADMKYVEHQGYAIEAGRKDLDDLEERMRIHGLELLVPRADRTTATAASIDSSELNSPLQDMASALEDALEKAIEYALKWVNVPADKAGSLVVNKDFGITGRDAVEIQELVKMRLAGEISSETFWEELKRRRFLADDFDPAQEKIRLRDDPGNMGDSGNVGGE